MTLFESCNNNSFECGANITIAVLSFLVIFLNLYYFLKTWRSQHFLTYEMFAILTATLDVKVFSLI